MRVLEFGNYIAGPFCGELLADLGADVVKIEPPGGGDLSRNLPPFMDGESAGYQLLNRNKRSVALNLKHPAGREVALRLARSADVIVENFRPGTMADLGLDYEAIHAGNPGVIYCSISGFGQDGPYRQRAAVDLIVQGMSGMLSVCGEPGQPPARPGVQISDVSGALFATYAILAAYIGRQQSGQGRHLDLSLLECSIAIAVWETSAYLATDVTPEPLGRQHRATAPYQVFQTADGFITIGAPSDALWRRLCAIIGREDLAAAPEFATVAKRKANDVKLADIIEHVTRTQGSQHWLARLEEAGLPCGPIYRYDEVFRDPQVVQRRVMVDYPHPRLGRIKTVRNPVHVRPEDIADYAAAPALGQHSAVVLRSLGYSVEEIEALAKMGTIGIAPATA